MLAPHPTLDGAAVAAVLGAAAFDPLIGTSLNFENERCRAVELRLPPGGGDAEALHQHCLPYGLVFLADTKLKLYHPNLAHGAAPPASSLPASVHVKDGTVADCFAVFKPITRGDTTPGYAVHQLTNASTSEWLRVYQVELK